MMPTYLRATSVWCSWDVDGDFFIVLFFVLAHVLIMLLLIILIFSQLQITKRNLISNCCRRGDRWLTIARINIACPNRRNIENIVHTLDLPGAACFELGALRLLPVTAAGTAFAVFTLAAAGLAALAGSFLAGCQKQARNVKRENHKLAHAHGTLTKSAQKALHFDPDRRNHH
jgi:hypothetical protein